MVVNLHGHSYYSLLDGLNSPAEIAAEAKRLGHPAVAITDHGSMSGHRELQVACKEEGIKPILGLEAYFSPTDRFDRSAGKKGSDVDKYNHLVILAQSQKGLENLYSMQKVAWEEGYYFKPRIDMELLERYQEGLIVLSACLSGVLAKAIEREDMETAMNWAEWFKYVFGDRYYIEVQAHNPLHINTGLFEIADSLSIPAVATMDSHFNSPKDREAEEAMLILSTGQRGVNDQNYNTTKGLSPMQRFDKLYPDRPISFKEIDVHLFGREDWESAFAEQGWHRQDIFDNTLAIADRIEEYTFYENLDLLPTPDVGEIVGDKRRKNPDAALRQLVEQGMQQRGLDSEEYLQRMEEELEVITGKNFSSYFLVVADAIRWAKKQGIRVGPGRGSGAGSLVNYVLGITDLDPIEHGLLFFRFINPERNDFPDIDTDIEIGRREEVKEYLRQKYGYAASIMTFGFFKDKGVIRDISRVFMIPLSEVNAVSKALGDGARWEDFTKSRDKRVHEFRMRYPEVARFGEQLRDRVRQQGIHPGGIIVSREPLEKYAPIEYLKNPAGEDRIPVISYDMNVAAEIGMIKLDILGNSALDAIETSVQAIKERHGKDVDAVSQRRDDPKVINLIASGDTVGIFQADTHTYRRALAQMNITGFADLAASNALVRPGAMNTVGASYIERSWGREPIEYIHPLMEEFTAETYGVIIYQEQVMQTVNTLAGFPMAKADKLRKIIGKKLAVEEFQPYYEAWMEGATKHISSTQAEQLWHDFEAHAGYSFNKSHAYAYSTISYQQAWLKYYYPLEFMYGLLRVERDDKKITDYLIEAKRKGLKILLPHANRSEPQWTLEGDAIRFGLINIKGVGDKAAKRILEHRPFESYAQLKEVQQTKGSGITSRIVDSLTIIGAAAFKDNPLTGEEPEHYYDYLGIPKFDYIETPDYVYAALSPVEEFNETDTMVFRAMVQNIKRGQGWSRVEFIDDTGTAAVFADEGVAIEKGQLYYILVANNRIMDYLEVHSLDESDKLLAKYLRDTPDTYGLLTPADKLVLRLAPRKTKAGKLMANVTLCNSDRKLKTFVVFPKTMQECYGKIQEGMLVDIKYRTLDDGALCLTRVLE